MNTRRACLMLMMAALVAIGSLGGAGCSGDVAACSNGSGPDCPPPPTSLIPFAQRFDKIDLVLMIDNSRSMEDKQQILADAVPDLLRGLTNPRCIDDAHVPAAQQPAGPFEPCPAGTRREITPVLDIHVGVVTSSLGGHGSDACAVMGDNACGNGINPTNDDHGHLISRQGACSDQSVPTYQSKGFLAWDPAQSQSPPGEKELGDGMSPGMVKSLRDLVAGAGQIGCGYESQLESWYRFLVDPEPYQTISVVGGKATVMGTDDVLLKQRADFLRPSSLLAIIMLTDENDCSTKEYGQFYFMAQKRNPANPQQTFHLPRARQECATNPNDPCCKSCGQGPGTCPADPTCTASPTLSDLEDDINLRCWDNKRRFGIDFLYPIDRYTQALTSQNVPNRAGEMVPNPLFTDLNPMDDDSNVRDTGLVFLAGIIGVPWQLIARDPSDLTKGFKNSDELVMPDNTGDSTWDRILGDPASFVPPKDAHMLEATKPRPGLAPPASPPGADPYNGHEYTIAKNDDLQYACIFDLPVSRDCSNAANVSCDCGDPLNDSPLCDPVTKTQQVRAKAYPGLRELAVLRSIGAQGIVASICPSQISNVSAADYGYRPGLRWLTDQLTTAITGKCLDRTLSPDKTGMVPCVIVEGRSDPTGECRCDAPRFPVPSEHAPIVAAAKALPAFAAAPFNCFCEMTQAGDPAHSSQGELDACQNDISPTPVIMSGPDAGMAANGWCYVDATTSPSTGNPDIVKDCPVEDKRLLRFLGQPMQGATKFIHCDN